MNVLTAVLAAMLGGGGLGGLAILLRFRVDKDSTVVDTVSKSVLVLERLNDRLEGDLLDERAARLKAEQERDAAYRALEAVRRPAPKV